MAKRAGPSYVKIPDSLSAVSQIDDANEVDAGSVGLSRRRVQAIWHSVRELYRSGAFPGISFCLRRGNQIVLNRALGHAAGNGPNDPADAELRLMQPDTPVCVYSASKAITAILVHKLAEEGGVDLSERVAHYIPDFARNGKAATTVSEVLSHHGGFPMFDLPRAEVRPELLLDWERCIELICNAPPAHRGAPRMAYHAVTGGFILAEVIQRVTGRSIQQYLDAKFRFPLGMKHFRFGLEPEFRDQVARNYVAGMPVRFPITKIVERTLMLPLPEVIEISNSSIFMDAVVPAANLYCTAEELSRFYQMLLNFGSYDGQQIMAPETVARAIAPVTRLQFDHTLKIPMRYSEGLMLGANPFGIYGPMSGRAFGHIGLMNIYGFADPARDISVGLLVTGKAILGSHLMALGELLTTIAWQCRGN